MLWRRRRAERQPQRTERVVRAASEAGARGDLEHLAPRLRHAARLASARLARLRAGARSVTARAAGRGGRGAFDTFEEHAHEQCAGHVVGRLAVVERQPLSLVVQARVGTCLRMQARTTTRRALRSGGRSLWKGRWTEM